MIKYPAKCTYCGDIEYIDNLTTTNIYICSNCSDGSNDTYAYNIGVEEVPSSERVKFEQMCTDTHGAYDGSVYFFPSTDMYSYEGVCGCCEAKVSGTVKAIKGNQLHCANCGETLTFKSNKYAMVENK
jgi:DNA-directed RNA polymerase subunit RPC12/RpoP